MKRMLLSLAALVAMQAAAQAGPPVNGLKLDTYFSQGWNTTLATTNGNSVNQGAPSTVSILESTWVDTGAVGGVNRHDITLSPDLGVSNQLFDIDDSFSVWTTVTLGAVSNTPRKEAGFHIISGVTGTSSFIINSDAGEIVAFGGGAPFKLFGNNGGGNGYVPGTPILMGFTMRAAGDGVGPLDNTIEYFIDRGLGLETSGPLAYSNLEGGPVNYSVSMYSQAAPFAAAPLTEVVSTTFANIRYSATPIPEPATVALGAMGLIGLAAIRRRLR